MKTYPLTNFHDHLRLNSDHTGWVVTKIKHMKNFQYSAVFHEFLKVTIKRTSTPDEKCILIIERMQDQDQVTLGWHRVKYELTKWWLVRLLKGNYSGSSNGRIVMASSSTDMPDWRATGYSGSDFLCSLEFNPGIRLIDFIKSAQKISEKLGGYNAINKNCYAFASQLYEKMKSPASLPSTSPNSQCVEVIGSYHNHKSKFALLELLESKSVRVFFFLNVGKVIQCN